MALGDAEEEVNEVLAKAASLEDGSKEATKKEVLLTPA